MELVKILAQYSTAILEVCGSAAIMLLGIWGLLLACWRLIKGLDKKEIFKYFRYDLFQGILVGLEFFVAADIINTAAVNPTFSSVGVLSIVIMIRTFLSFILELEMTGKWPWEKNND